jgi:hypothetical protein
MIGKQSRKMQRGCIGRLQVVDPAQLHVACTHCEIQHGTHNSDHRMLGESVGEAVS